ncbi:MAG: cob(I)yrinic acid a,c-diamide adenosyltransferase [Candidatus Altiarchaeota archaeon]|nr:cob(I)yrinic acid a,c-diamide adenosyltransferase [Candidatus Altiarchaeota archaeon]
MAWSNLGLVHIYTGNGKGKTTAALGLAIRALSHGFTVCMIQFMKGGRHIGELKLAEKYPNFSVRQFGKECPFSEKMKIGATHCGNCRSCFFTPNESREKAAEAMKEAVKAATSGGFDMVILDEINVVLDKKIVGLDDAVRLIQTKNPDTELVLTGRSAPKELYKYADYVSEISEVKHPMNRGIVGRRGVEY